MSFDLTQADLAALSHDEWTGKNHADGGVCDFCLAVIDPATVVTYTANDLLVDTLTAPDGSVLTHVADPYWAACPNCDPHVAAGDPEALADYVAEHTDYERLGVPITKDEIRVSVLSIYRRLFEGGMTRTEGTP